MNSLQKNELKNNGYIKLQSCVRDDLLLEAQKCINRWRHEILIGNRKLGSFEKIGICHDCHAYDRSEFMQELYKISYNYAQHLLGEENVFEYGRIIIGWPPAFENASKRQWWHIDNVDAALNSTNPHIFPRFQLIIGFPLTDITNEKSGGLVIWPGQHRYISQIFKSHDNVKDGLMEIQNLMYSSLPPGNIKHLYEKRGDVVLFNSLLPHGTAINESPYFADKVYFRFGHSKSVLRSGISACRRPWGNWHGI